MAGRLEDAMLLQQTADKFQRVFETKIDGAWNLHLATLTDSLDHFILFSSAASVFGSPGQANHAAANAVLDLLAWHRRSQGLPGASINWGPWSEVGAAARRGVDKRQDLGGVGMLAPEEGLAVLQYLLQRNAAAPAQVASFRLHLDRLTGSVGTRPLFELLRAAASAATGPDAAAESFLVKLRTTPQAERQQMVVQQLQRLVARTLGVEDASSIAGDAALFSLGLDSLTSLELRNAIEANFQQPISATLIFDHPTVEALAVYLLARISEPSEAPRDPSPAAQTPVIVPASDDERDPSPELSNRDPSGELVASLIEGIQELSTDLDHWEGDDDES
jgi:acyl carrier protein